MASAPEATAVDITQGQRATLLSVAVVGHAIKHVFASSFFVLLPEIKAGLALSNTQVGVLSAVRFMVGGLTNLPAGFVGDRFHARRALILGLSIALIGLFYLATGLAQGFWALSIAAALSIGAVSLWHPVAISALSRQFAARRGLAIALHGAGGSVGEALGPVLAGTLLSFLVWRTVLQGSVVPAVLLGLGIWLVLRTVPVGNDRAFSLGDYIVSLRRLLGSGRMLLVLLFAVGYSGAQSTLATFLPIYLREDLGVSTVRLGLYLFLAQAAGIVSQPLMGYASDRLGRKAVLVAGLAAFGLALIALYLTGSGWPFIAAMVVSGAFSFSLMAILLASASDLAGREVQAASVSLVFGTATAMGAVAPYLAGLAADAWGVASTFLLAAGATLAAGLLAGVTRWQRTAM
ncbi:MAG: MFS transporter [Chloroflexi bacterium]|nr:MFS transporter [Chloroflexota bacterium]